MTELQQTILSELTTDSFYFWEVAADPALDPLLRDVPEDQRLDAVIREVREMLETGWLEVERPVDAVDETGTRKYMSVSKEESLEIVKDHRYWIYDSPGFVMYELIATEAGDAVYFASGQKT
jgi:hypothetical protein